MRNLFHSPLLCMVFLLAGCLTSAAPQSGLVAAAPSATASDPTPGSAAAECAARKDQFLADPNGYEQLLNPVLTSPAQVAARQQEYAGLYACLGNEPASLSSSWKGIYRLLEYFLIFAGGYQAPESATHLALVDLGSSTDPAVVRLRQQAGITPPPGYIFVRFYTQRAAMPPRVAVAFQDPNVAGVTILVRYVAVLAEKKYDWSERALQAQEIPVTVSHELVHAYLNARAGVQHLESFPTWYQEGLAIYFSGSGQGHTVITPQFTLRSTSPQEYQEYENNLKFLEKQLGQARLLQQVRQSIERADPALLYQGLQITGYPALLEQAGAWKQRQVRLKAGIGLAVLLLLGWAFLRWMPEVRCRRCGYSGKRKEFIDGICPQCGRPAAG